MTKISFESDATEQMKEKDLLSKKQTKPLKNGTENMTEISSDSVNEKEKGGTGETPNNLYISNNANRDRDRQSVGSAKIAAKKISYSRGMLFN